MDLVRGTVNVERAAQLIGVSRNSLYEAIRRDESPMRVIRVGRRLVIPVAELERLLGVGAAIHDDM